MITDADVAKLSPQMQEAVKFIQLWNLSDSMKEFLEAMGWPVDQKHKTKAHMMAFMFRKKTVPLKSFPRGRASGKKLHYDFRVLEAIGLRSMAELGRKRAAAEDELLLAEEARKKIIAILLEMRKYKDMLVNIKLQELEKQGV